MCSYQPLSYLPINVYVTTQIKSFNECALFNISNKFMKYNRMLAEIEISTTIY